MIPSQLPLYVYRGTVKRVVDGDTVDVVVDLGFRTNLQIRVRLLAIDAPEVVGTERAAGLESAAVLREWIEGREVILETHKDQQGKFGRWLGIIWMPGEAKSINNRLVAEGYAQPWGEG